MNKPAENMLRLYDSVIYPGKCEHMRKWIERDCVLYGRMISPIYIL